jgi:hypothetical protein
MSSAAHNAAIRLSIPQISKVQYYTEYSYTLENTTNLLPSNRLQHVEFVKLLYFKYVRYDKKKELRISQDNPICVSSKRGSIFDVFLFVFMFIAKVK